MGRCKCGAATRGRSSGGIRASPPGLELLPGPARGGCQRPTLERRPSAARMLRRRPPMRDRIKRRNCRNCVQRALSRPRSTAEASGAELGRRGRLLEPGSLQTIPSLRRLDPQNLGGQVRGAEEAMPSDARSWRVAGRAPRVAAWDTAAIRLGSATNRARPIEQSCKAGVRIDRPVVTSGDCSRLSQLHF